MVLSIAAFVEDEEKRAEIIRSDRIREKSLEIAYKIPGYQKLPLNEKNKIYDSITNSIMREEKS